MARIRQFKPSFFTDDKVGRLSRDARLFFFGVLSEADDEGRLVDSPKRLAGVVFPFDEDVTPKKVERWINELEAQKMVVRYQHEGGRFLYVRKFKDHQRMSHPTPSTLPSPPPDGEHASSDPPEKLRSGSREPPEDFVPEGLLEGVKVFEGVSIAPADADRKEAAHPRDPLWDAMLSACGVVGTPTASARGAYNRARKDLAEVGATPDEVHRRADILRAKWPDIDVTPSSLARHWAEAAHPPDRMTNGTRRTTAGQDAITRVFARLEAKELPR